MEKTLVFKPVSWTQLGGRSDKTIGFCIFSFADGGEGQGKRKQACDSICRGGPMRGCFGS